MWFGRREVLDTPLGAASYLLYALSMAAAAIALGPLVFWLLWFGIMVALD